MSDELVIIRKGSPVTRAPKLVGDRTMRFVMSDGGQQDRDGDFIDAAGWKLDWFEQNPVAPPFHDYSVPAMGSWATVHVESQQLIGDLTFAQTTLADELLSLYVDGHMRGCSVGFMPIKFKFLPPPSDGSPYMDAPDAEGGVITIKLWGVQYLEQELWECSPCSVPSNPAALALTRSKLAAKGFKFAALAPAPVVDVEDLRRQMTQRDAPRAFPGATVSPVRQEATMPAIKSGREISAKNHETLSAMHADLSTAHKAMRGALKDMGEFLDSSAPGPTSGPDSDDPEYGDSNDRNQNNARNENDPAGDGPFKTVETRSTAADADELSDDEAAQLAAALRGLTGALAGRI